MLERERERERGNCHHHLVSPGSIQGFNPHFEFWNNICNKTYNLLTVKIKPLYPGEEGREHMNMRE